MAWITPPAGKCNILWVISVGLVNVKQMLGLQPRLNFWRRVSDGRICPVFPNQPLELLPLRCAKQSHFTGLHS